jgi:hypothetical protein
MSAFDFFGPKTRGVILMMALVPGGFNMQATSVALSSATVVPEEVASLDLFLDASSGARPSAIQWTFRYSNSGIRRFAVEDGPALGSVAKTVICSGDASALKCLIVGLNSEAIPDGVVARVSAVLESGVNSTTILVSDALGVSGNGDPISISSANGTITAAGTSPAREPSPRGRQRE